LILAIIYIAAFIDALRRTAIDIFRRLAITDYAAFHAILFATLIFALRLKAGYYVIPPPLS